MVVPLIERLLERLTGLHALPRPTLHLLSRPLCPKIAGFCIVRTAGEQASRVVASLRCTVHRGYLHDRRARCAGRTRRLLPQRTTQPLARVSRVALHPATDQRPCGDGRAAPPAGSCLPGAHP